jgi:hypothetical protein
VLTEAISLAIGLPLTLLRLRRAEVAAIGSA